MSLLNNLNLCYIISIALQLAGALMLTVSFWGNTRKRIIDTYFPETVSIIEDRENISINRKEVRNIASSIYLNRIAFIYISMGYLLGVYASLDNVDKSCVVAKIICWTIGLILLGNIIANSVAKIIFNKNAIVNYEEVKGRVTEVATEADIDALFEEIFKK